LYGSVRVDQEVHDAARSPVERLDEVREPRGERLEGEKWLEVGPECRRVFERIALRVRLQEEIERIVRLEVGDEMDTDDELLGFLGNHDARHEVAMGVLEPVQKMRARFDVE
jgi:hypothetical protein